MLRKYIFSGQDNHDPMDSTYWLGKMRQADLRRRHQANESGIFNCKWCDWCWKPRVYGKVTRIKGQRVVHKQFPKVCPNCIRRNWLFVLN